MFIDSYKNSNKQLNEIINSYFEINPKNLKIFTEQIIGSGEFSTIYLAEWNETIVAAKMINEKFYKFNIDIEIILQELNNYNHPNIIHIFGYVKEPFIIIMEYIERGTLYKNITKFTTSRRTEIIKDILKALIYLQNNNKYINIKSNDIYLTNYKTIKLSVFKIMNYVLNNMNKSENYIFGLKDAINSFGIFLYEFFENKQYFGQLNFTFYTPNKIKNIIEQILILNTEVNSFNYIYNLLN